MPPHALICTSLPISDFNSDTILSMLANIDFPLNPPLPTANAASIAGCVFETVIADTPRSLQVRARLITFSFCSGNAVTDLCGEIGTYGGIFMNNGLLR